jgi:hypothetical protein
VHLPDQLGGSFGECSRVHEVHVSCARLQGLGDGTRLAGGVERVLRRRVVLVPVDVVLRVGQCAAFQSNPLNSRVPSLQVDVTSSAGPVGGQTP